jgi:hypothetical protein
MIEKRVYLICPVRNCDEKTLADMDDYVAQLEKGGYIVHYPPRDVDQTQTGMSILKAHRKAMSKCNEVHIWWDGDSKGSHFDLGMGFMLAHLRDLPVKFVSANSLERTEGKSFVNVILDLEKYE